MLENVNLQKEQGTKHCSLTQADCQESHGLVTDGLFFFFLLNPYTKRYRQEQRFRQMCFLVLPRAPGTCEQWIKCHCAVGSRQSLPRFCPAYLLVYLWVLHAKTGLTEQLSIWAVFSVTKKTMWSRGIWGLKKGKKQHRNKQAWTRGKWGNPWKYIVWLYKGQELHSTRLAHASAAAWGFMVHRTQRSENNVARSGGSGEQGSEGERH